MSDIHNNQNLDEKWMLCYNYLSEKIQSAYSEASSITI